MAKHKGAVRGGISKNQRDVTARAPQPSAPVKPTPIPIPAGAFEIPGGTITCDGKGVSRYQGEPYQKMTLKRKYHAGGLDLDPQGKVRGKMK